MTDLIKISTERTVNARELHEFLESKQEFSNWIRARIEQYGFIDNQDYTTILSNRSDGLPGKPRTEYHVSIDMAKELSMVERNARGKQARQYFIECERRAKYDPMEALEDPDTLRSLLLSYSEKVRGLEIENKTLEFEKKDLEPKARAHDRLSGADGSLTLQAAAKALQIERVNTIFPWLHRTGWIFRRGKTWHAYQDKIKKGYMVQKVTTITSTDGNDKTTQQARVTPKGLTKLAKILGRESQLPLPY
jgi:anti-repressor protein